MKYQEKKTSLQVFEDFKISEIISSQVINSNCSNPYAIKIDLVGFSQTATKGIEMYDNSRGLMNRLQSGELSVKNSSSWLV